MMNVADDRMHAVIVMPCLNEAHVLNLTCRSLGFGEASENQPLDTTLIIIDNGSTDPTLSVAREVQRNSRPGSVILDQERERGYVPPRRTGNLLARDFATSGGMEPSRILLLQADADTWYAGGYVEAMRRAATLAGPHAVLEGLAEYAPETHHGMGPYLRLMAETDERVLSLLGTAPEDEIVCTDAVSAYRMGDYFTWGGHLQELDKGGEEIFAETTRLRMRSLLWGGRKTSVFDAVAYPSERKVLLRGAEEFATAGFPRGERWRSAWRQSYRGPSSAVEFGAAPDHPEVARCIKMRERHLLALFGLLPVHAARAAGSPPPHADPAVLRITASLPARDAATLARTPGQLITDVLDIVDHRPRELDTVLA